MLEIFFISFVIIFIRLIQLSYNKYLIEFFSYGPVGDASTYLFLVQFFRKNNCGVPDNRCLIGSKPVMTPSLYMKIVGLFFSDKELFERPWLPNFIIFSIFVPIGLILYKFLIYKINSQISYEDYLILLILSTCLFLTQAENINYGEQRIHFWTLQPRFLAILTNSLAWLFYFSLDNNFMQISSMSLFFILGLNISYFPRQSIFFISILYFIISGDFSPIIALIISIIFSSLIFRGEFLESIIPQLGYSLNYFKNTPKPGESSNYFMKIIKYFFVSSIKEIVNYSIFIITLAFISIIYFNNYSEWAYGSNIFLFNYFCFLLSVFIVFCLTSLRFFSSFGESWRYIAANVYFLSSFTLPIFLLEIINNQKLVIFVVSILVVLQFLISKNFSKITFNNDNKFLRPLLAKYYDELKNARWFGIPYKISNYCVTHGYGKTTFEFQYGNNPETLTKEFFEDTVPWHTLKRDKSFIKKHKVTHVLLHKDYEYNENGESRLPKTKLKLLIENEKFAIYEIA